MMRSVFCILAIVVLLVPFEAVDARIYKWVDDEGNVQYTQTPPPDNREAETVKIRSSSVSDEQAKENLDKLTGEGGEEQGQKDDEAEKLAMEQDEIDKENCEITKRNLELLESDARVQVRDEEGNIVRLDDEARQAQIEANQQQLKTFCK